MALLVKRNIKKFNIITRFLNYIGLLGKLEIRIYMHAFNIVYMLSCECMYVCDINFSMSKLEKV